MKVIWLKKTGWLYIPVYTVGPLIIPHCVIFLMPVFATTIRSGHYLGDWLYNMCVYNNGIVLWWK